MSLSEKLLEDLKVAMRAKDELARDTLRMLRADIGKLELDGALDEGAELQVLIRAVKTRRDSVTAYQEGGRQDLADSELAEIAIIERYLPKALSEDDAKDAILAIIAEVGATTKRDMGKVMKAIKAKYQGQIDGKLASRIVGGELS